MVYKLCELGVLFKRVVGFIEMSLGRFPAEDVGTVGQAFCIALKDELSDYYKLLVVLEVQSSNLIPLLSKMKVRSKGLMKIMILRLLLLLKKILLLLMKLLLLKLRLGVCSC
jgi:gamma-tubulin complex component 3